MAFKKIKYPSEFGIRNHDKDNNWENIDLKTYEFNKPIVICLSGNSAMYDELANGFCKRAERQLELLLKNFNQSISIPTDYVDILGCSYGSTATVTLPDMTEEEKAKFNAKYPSIDDYLEENPNQISYSYVGKMHRKEIFDVTEFVLLPRVTDKDGNKLPIDTACKNLSQVTFFTWCHGAREANLILKKLNYLCRKIGYDKNETNNIISSVMHITYAPITSENYCPSVRFDSLRDDFIFPTTNEYIDLDGIKLEIDEADEDSQIYYDSLHIYSSKLTNKDSKDNDEHLFDYLDRDKDWNIKHLHPNADCVSQMMSWALSRAVENSIANQNSDTYIPKPSIAELMEELDNIKNYFNSEDLMFIEEM